MSEALPVVVGYLPQQWDEVYLDAHPRPYGVVLRVYPHCGKALVRFGPDDHRPPLKPTARRHDE